MVPETQFEARKVAGSTIYNKDFLPKYYFNRISSLLLTYDILVCVGECCAVFIFLF